MANYYEEEMMLFYEHDYTANISFIFSFPKQFCIYGQQKYIFRRFYIEAQNIIKNYKNYISIIKYESNHMKEELGSGALPGLMLDLELLKMI